jgi:hypothetical protein
MGEQMKPEKVKDGLTFFPIPEFGAASAAFGASEDKFFNRYNLPDVPHEFQDMAQNLFFKGGELPKFHESVDQEKAHTAIGAWLSSWAPAHESKIATVGYAFWLWTHKDALSE